MNQQPPARRTVFRFISVILVVSGVAQVTIGFHMEGIISTALLLSGTLEIGAGGFFWFWTGRNQG